jgi:DNA-binding PadR family transcriptional regulator
MIELAILGLLHDQDRHGYELRKRMAELGDGSGVSYGSLYPALSRLERNGYVRALTPSRAAAAGTSGRAGLTGPMTGAITGELAALRHRKAARAAAASQDSGEHEGAGDSRRADRRNRKVYRITDRGRERFDELLRTADPTDERAFGMQVAFCGHLPPADRLALFDRRRAALVDQLAALSRPPEATAGPTSDATATSADVPYRRSRREHDIHTINHHLAWLDELAELATAAPDAPSVAEVATNTGGTTP